MGKTEELAGGGRPRLTDKLMVRFSVATRNWDSLWFLSASDSSEALGMQRIPEARGPDPVSSLLNERRVVFHLNSSLE